MSRFAYVCADRGVPVPGTKGASNHVASVVRELVRSSLSGEVFAARGPADEAPSVFEGARLRPLRDLDDCSESLEFIYERYSLWHTDGLKRARRLGRPFVLEVNSPLPEEARRYRGLGEHERALAVARELAREADGIVCVSQEVASWVRELRGSGTGVWVIPNGVDPDLFSRERALRQASASERETGVLRRDRLGAIEADRSSDAGKRAVVPRIAFCGSFRPWHGLGDLADALSLLARRLDPAPQLLCVGDGPQRGEFEERIGRAGLSGGVTITGMVPQADVPSLLVGADVAVAPYPALESFYFSPLKLYEFMALGIPVVASDIGQVRAILAAGARGWLYRPGDASALARAIADVLEQPDQARTIAEAARDWALANASWGRRVSEILRRVRELPPRSENPTRRGAALEDHERGTPGRPIRPGSATRMHLPEAGLPGLEPLVTGDLWARWSREGHVFPLASVRDAVRYVRLKPGVSCRIAVFSPRLATDSGIPLGVCVHLFADADRAATAFRKLRIDRRRASVEPGAFLDAGHAAVVAPFLDDPELPALHDVRRPYRIKQWLLAALGRESRVSKREIRLELLRYKPGRRAVWRVGLASGRHFHLRIERPGDAAYHARLSEAVRHAAQGSACWSVPALRFLDAGRGIVLRDWVDGDLWSEIDAPDQIDAASELVGNALASLHELDSSLIERETPAASGSGASDRATPRAAEHVESLARLLPGQAARLRELAGEIDSAILEAGGDSCLSHGDLHPDQVVLHDGRVSWLDLDRARHGDRALDLATCRAHDDGDDAAGRRQAAALRAYRRSARSAPDNATIEVVEQAVRFARLVEPFRRLDPEWPAVMTSAIARVECSLRAARSRA